VSGTVGTLIAVVSGVMRLGLDGTDAPTDAFLALPFLMVAVLVVSLWVQPGERGAGDWPAALDDVCPAPFVARCCGSPRWISCVWRGGRGQTAAYHVQHILA